MLAIGFPILILTDIALVLSKTAPHLAKTVEAYSENEVAFLQEVSAAVAAGQTEHTPFDRKLPQHELVRVDLTALHQKDGATEVTVPRDTRQHSWSIGCRWMRGNVNLLCRQVQSQRQYRMGCS